MAGPGKTEYLIVTGCVAGGCAVVIPPLWLIPSTVNISVAEIAVHAFKPDLIIPNEKRIEAFKQGGKLDVTRAILSGAVVLLTEIPAAIPQVLPKMAEFSNQVPNWVPEVAAIAAVIYGLSWLNTRGNRKNLEKKTSQF